MGRKDRAQRWTLPDDAPILAAATIDSHTHLDTTQTESGRSVAELVGQARQAGVSTLIQVGCDVAGSRWAVQAAADFDDVWATVALHPNDAARFPDNEALEAALAQIDELAAADGVVGVGETGLDYFRTGPDGRGAQQHSFERHIEIAKRYNRTLVIHDRDAHEDVFHTLEHASAPERVVLHCFSGDEPLARRAAQHGWYLSFAGTVTFPSAEPLREALRILPDELILVETDAPYLTPIPHRGRINASYLIPHTVAFMAEVRGVTTAAMAELLRRNAERAFRLPTA